MDADWCPQTMLCWEDNTGADACCVHEPPPTPLQKVHFNNLAAPHWYQQSVKDNGTAYHPIGFHELISLQRPSKLWRWNVTLDLKTVLHLHLGCYERLTVKPLQNCRWFCHFRLYLGWVVSIPTTTKAIAMLIVATEASVVINLCYTFVAQKLAQMWKPLLGHESSLLL